MSNQSMPRDLFDRWERFGMKVNTTWSRAPAPLRSPPGRRYAESEFDPQWSFIGFARLRANELAELGQFPWAGVYALVTRPGYGANR